MTDPETLARWAEHARLDREAHRRAHSPRWWLWRASIARRLIRWGWATLAAWEYSHSILAQTIRETLTGDEMLTPMEALDMEMQHWEAD